MQPRLKLKWNYFSHWNYFKIGGTSAWPSLPKICRGYVPVSVFYIHHCRSAQQQTSTQQCNSENCVC